MSQRSSAIAEKPREFRVIWKLS